jgi:integrase
VTRAQYQRQGIGEESIDILLASRRPSTRKQYKVYSDQWLRYCVKNKVEPLEPYLSSVLDFLSILFESGDSYSTINTARSSLSSFIKIEGRPAGEHPEVVRFLKGVFNLRPALPKSSAIWDPDTVLDVLKTLSPVQTLTMKMLTLKCATLLWLLSAQRGQTMKLIDVRNIKVADRKVDIAFGDLLKTTRPGFHQKDISLKAYLPDLRLCIVTVLTEYLRRRNVNSPKGCHQLFISYQKPYGPVSTSTIARWVKTIMQMAGIDTQVFTPHSLRSASTSAALRAEVPLDSILAAAGWSRESTFRKHYNKPLLKENEFDLLESRQNQV